MRGRSRVLAAAASGLLVASSFPGWLTPGLTPWTGWLAWIALVPALAAFDGATPWSAAAAGWAGGAAFFGSALYWVMEIRELEIARVPAWAALAAAYGLYWALWGWMVARAGTRRALLLAAPAWWACEWLRGRLFTGFPWLPLGATQWGCAPVFLAARTVGVAGIGLGIAAVNVAVWAVIRGIPGRRTAVTLAGAWVLALAGLSALAERGVRATAATGDPIRVAALQGSFSEEDKWSLPVGTMLARYEALAAAAAKAGATIMVWPETATASAIGDLGMAARLTRLAVRTRAVQIVGALSAEPSGGVANGAFVVTPAGVTGGYRKMHLVPFGEYIPGWARTALPFVRKLTEGLVDLVPGVDQAPLDLPGPGRLKVGVFVCYEAVFPELGRAQAARCAALFVNVTNDAWYHDSAATFQHALGPIARAVEDGRWIVRSANTGFSFIAGPDGRLVTGPGLSVPGIVVADVHSGADPCRPTGYVRFGELPLAGYAFLLLAAAWGTGSKRS